MAKSSREKLQIKLLDIVENVYFQPPANIRLTYPCIIYRRANTDITYAGDSVYQAIPEYQVTVVEKDADTPLSDEVLHSFRMIAQRASYVTDGLYHSQFTLYYY